RYLATEPCDAVLAAPELAVLLARDGDLPPVIAIVKSRDVDAALVLFEAGVDEVISEPVDELAIVVALRHVATLPRRDVGAAVVPARPALVGDGEAMQKLRALIDQLGKTRSTVLILGESGTGKELVARAVHEASPRRDRRFVAINCAAIPAALLESELFGHKRGAFTDAVRDKPGLFEDADGGTLFLDEVGELPLALQAKLLRALADGEIRRVGDSVSVKVDVRIVAATLRDLSEDVASGRFREDLYYRLNVVPVRIPPLRERSEDIPELARFFARKTSARHQLGPIELTDAVIDTLRRQPWPGNVRELENVIERALVLADGPEVDLAFLGTVMNVATRTGASDGGALSIKKATRELEQDLIRRALGVTGGNRTNAAKLLEISHRALLYKMKEYGIS
ncbi:MAG: sigma 54-interacting transcriptional regulator, partial [Myxococcota bacterium]|nr:sigma 54-interacting transcriptional regulator [Myxococcota bacterium]